MRNDDTRPAPNPDDLTESPTAVAPPQLPDGAWFRRERERIAISRRTVARHLGIPDRRIITLELRNQPVPESWLPLVTSLGFRSPADPSATPDLISLAQPPTEQAQEHQPSSPLHAPEAPARAAAAVDPSPATPEPLQESAPARPNEASPDATSSAEPATQSEPATAAPEKLPPLPELPRGRWLRERRYARNLSLSGTSRALQASIDEITTVETSDLPVPPSWLPTLRTLKFYQASEGDRIALKRPLLTGDWLQRMRHEKRLSAVLLSAHLGIGKSILRRVEQRRLPLSPEWLPGLQKLGFPVPETSPPSSAPAKNAPPVSSSASAPPSQQKQLSGAWLRRHRERLGLMQKTLSQELGISQSVLCHIEREDRAIPAGWWPTLKVIGLPLPAQHAPPTPLSQLTGPWLQRHRKRLRLFIKHICDQLSISPKLLRATEARKAALPTEWLPVLKKLGFPIPAQVALPAGTRAETPAPPAPSLPHGAWLRAERERLGLTRKKLAHQLHKKEATLRPVENGSSPLPKSWLPTLQRLGFRLPPSAPPEERAKPTDSHRKSAESKPPAPKKQAPAELQPADLPASPLPTRAAELRAMVEMVVSYRLKLGRFSGQSAAELLSSIGNDLRQAGLEQAITFEQIEAALRRLFSP